MLAWDFEIGNNSGRITGKPIAVAIGEQTLVIKATYLTESSFADITVKTKVHIEENRTTVISFPF